VPVVPVRRKAGEYKIALRPDDKSWRRASSSKGKSFDCLMIIIYKWVVKSCIPILLVFFLSACTPPVDAPPDPTSIFTSPPGQATETLVVPTATPIFEISTSTPTALPAFALDDIPAYLTSVPESFNSDYCKDTRPLQLLSDLRNAIQNRDGELLSSLVSPDAGVGVRYIRDGNVITYFDNVKFVFETTYEADWGPGAGSGLPVKGSFQAVVLPSLEKVFLSNSTVTCNQLILGGATYIAEFPYEGMNFHSVHFPGTDAFGGLDWETWAVGMLRQEGKPMLAALIRFAWEP
jgi:hypothetical protein